MNHIFLLFCMIVVSDCKLNTVSFILFARFYCILEMEVSFVWWSAQLLESVGSFGNYFDDEMWCNLCCSKWQPVLRSGSWAPSLWLVHSLKSHAWWWLPDWTLQLWRLVFKPLKGSLMSHYHKINLGPQLRWCLKRLPNAPCLMRYLHSDY